MEKLYRFSLNKYAELVVAYMTAEEKNQSLLRENSNRFYLR